jgi:hypothetical protein
MSIKENQNANIKNNNLSLAFNLIYIILQLLKKTPIIVG